MKVFLQDGTDINEDCLLEEPEFIRKLLKLAKYSDDIIFSIKNIFT